MAQSSPSAKYKQHLSLAVDQSSEVLDATFHRTTSMQKNSSLFVPKKERQMAMKVIPYPSSDTTQEIKQERQRRSFRWMLGNVIFSAGIEKLNLATVAAFLVLIYVDFGFDENFADQRQSLDLISLALIALFFLEDCAKFGIIGFVITTQPYIKSYWTLLDSLLTLATSLSILLTILAMEMPWDSQYFSSAARVLRLTFAIRRINEVRNVRERSKKQTAKQGFSVELAADKVRQVLRTVLEQPWLHNNFELFRDLQWCLEVIESNSLNQAIVTVRDYQQGPQEEELINIVNQYSKSARRNSAVLMSRKSASNIPLTRRSSVPAAEMTDEVKMCLSTIDSMDFDIFKLKSITKGNELLTLMHLFFSKKDLLQELDIDQGRFANYIGSVQSGYNASNMYHTATHAGDVTQTLHYFLEYCDAAHALSLTSTEIAAGYLAAAVHDYEHPGLNNAFLIGTQSDLAIRYNDRSVLENHHVSAAFALATSEELDIFAQVQPDHFSRLRTLMITMVLGTDVVHHFSMLSRFKTKFESCMGTSLEDKDLCLEMLLHAADISNPTKPWHLCRRWAELVLNEFWEQGDKEREMGMPMGYLTDRYTANVQKSQVGFIDVIVLPTYEALLSVFPAVELNRDNLLSNREKWRNLDEQLTTTRAQPTPH